MKTIISLLYAIALTLGINAKAQTVSSFRVMTFNLWHGGDGVKLSKERTVNAQLEAIRISKADVVGLQEQTSGHSDNASRAKLLADSLGWNCYIIDGSRAVISHFPLQTIKSIGGNTSQAVLLTLAEGKEMIFGVMHLMYTPYEPYDIADGTLKTAEEAEQSARETRLHQVQAMLQDIAPARTFGTPAILVGDFNEPSCLDWTPKAIADRNDPVLPFAVNWPATSLLIHEGFFDTYRDVYPDVKTKPGYTWTSKPGLFRDPDVLDRIDLIYHTKQFKTKGAWMVGEKAKDVDLQLSDWPSDHRAVVAEFTY